MCQGLFFHQFGWSQVVPKHILTLYYDAFFHLFVLSLLPFFYLFVNLLIDFSFSFLPCYSCQHFFFSCALQHIAIPSMGMELKATSFNRLRQLLCSITQQVYNDSKCHSSFSKASLRHSLAVLSQEHWGDLSETARPEIQRAFLSFCWGITTPNLRRAMFSPPA